MTADDLLTRCRALGIELAAGEEGALKWEADADPPSDLLADLAANKADVLALLCQPPFWDANEAEYLLAELRTAVDRIKADFGGRPPAPLATLLADALVISARYVRDHDAEFARGWNVMELLRDMMPLVQGSARNFAFQPISAISA